MNTLTNQTDKRNLQSLRLQAVLEDYFRALRERIPALIEVQGGLPRSFWAQEQTRLVSCLKSGQDDLFSKEIAHQIIALLTASVDELVVLEAIGEVSLPMLRHELRIGPLSDARAEKITFRRIEGENVPQLPSMQPTANLRFDAMLV